ncbi:hypothetical protein JX266_002951 [Neoarthrinium moseri]|uniref:uncharacterized protein n=1 Tax=Neoarthrinium moseri TaxID=1658444 RepID=UPI001FDB2B89|nr:uncharacterized protein JN550_004150 [Neoarthrinium moseri]KAI1852098.1 hypothetical protein JX266_002951 [Neoarthrinium moseri]KAI1871947.1 hypothetical protein JN550_004150 [Neoarthrinium moseri]
MSGSDPHGGGFPAARKQALLFIRTAQPGKSHREFLVETRPRISVTDLVTSVKPTKPTSLPASQADNYIPYLASDSFLGPPSPAAPLGALPASDNRFRQKFNGSETSCPPSRFRPRSVPAIPRASYPRRNSSLPIPYESATPSSAMVFELHVWGQAFGLPSIEPECLAALSYLGFAVPRGDWTLIASNDVSVTPDHILPALHHNGTWTSGYLNIVSYLAQHHGISIGENVSSTQQADTLAYASYLSSRGAALVAFSLYVSPSAWADLTRPAYSSILPFPLTWTVPLKIRASAIAKTEHLGLDHLAADVDPEDGSSESKTTAPVTATGFLRLPLRPTVSSTMQPEQVAAIRLQSLTEDFLSVLDELRGSRHYFFGDKPSALDFLAYGYLRLLRVRTPHPFMEKCMKRSQAGQRLLQFLDLMHNTQVIRWQEENLAETLPWAEPAPRGVVGTLGQFTNDVLENTPGVGDTWKTWCGEGVKSEDQGRDPMQVAIAVGGAVVALVAVGGALVFRSLPPFGATTQYFEAPRRKTGLHQFGAIGAMFDDLPGFDATPRPSHGQRDTVYQGDHVEVAVDVEPEGSGIEPPHDGNIAEVGVGMQAGDKSGRV